MQYYVEDKKAQRRGGLIALLLYVVALVFAVAVVEFTVEVPPPSHTIEIEFVEQTPPTPEPVKIPPPPTPKVAPQRQVENKGEEQKIAPEPQKVNHRALFKGRAAEGGTQHEGEEQIAQTGTQGNKSEQANRSDFGAGKGVEGASWNLSGRTIKESLPKPNYAQYATGVVVVEILVDASGVVISATYSLQGSTTSNAELVEAAIAAARKARFSASDRVAQAGTIAYNFVLE